MREVVGKWKALAIEWRYALVILLVLLVVGFVLLIPTETVDMGSDVTLTRQPYALIGSGLIGFSWIGFLWPGYVYLVKPYM